MPGTWSVAAVTSKYSTLLEGLQKAVAGKAQILYAKGSNLMYDAQLQKTPVLLPMKPEAAGVTKKC